MNLPFVEPSATPAPTISKSISKPLPIRITVTTAPGLSVFTTTGSSEITYRHCQPCDVAASQNDSLIGATVQALTMLNQYRVRRLLTLLQIYLRDVENVPTEELEIKLPIEIRTGSDELIEAGNCTLLQTKDKSEPHLISEFRKQLQRFDVRWIRLYSDDAPELCALRRWATLNFHPGKAGSHDGPTRDDCRMVLGTYESMAAD